MRSKTFVIEKKHVLYRVAGKGGQIRLIIDGYQLIRDPIYGGLAFTVNHGDRPQWHVQDVSMWLGHNAYIEIVDDGDGYVAVDQILFSDGGPPTPRPNGLLERTMPGPAPTEALLAEIIDQWQAGKLTAQPDWSERLEVLNWMLREGSSNGSAKDAKLTELADKCKQIEAGLPLSRRAFAMAEINLFGEVGVLKTINNLIDAAAERNDALLHHISDFIRADERTHVRKGAGIIKVMSDLDAKALEQRTRELFTECLVSLGAFQKDMDVFTVSRDDLEHLVGE